jgi:hypothetical protein
MLPRQVTDYSMLLAEGISAKEIKNLSAALRIFPTPYKGIYYIPGDEERDGCFIDKPGRILFRATSLFLGNKNFYFSCRTAEEFWGIKWQPIGHVHIVNEKISRIIDISARVKLNNKRKTWRAKRIARIMELYGNKIVFHKVKSIADAKFKRTPYGTYALKSQIKKDKKRFREKED